MENSKLEMLSTMVTSALAKIIDENSKSDFTVADVMAKCSTNESVEEFNNSVDFRIQLIDKLLTVTNFKTWFDSLDDTSKDQVIEYVGGRELSQSSVASWLHNQSISDVGDTIEAAGITDDICEYYKDDILDDWFDNADAEDIKTRASSYVWDNIEADIKDRCKDAIDNI